LRAAGAGRWHQLFSLFRLLTLIFEAARRVHRLYIGADLPRPKLYNKAERPDHPYVRMYARRSDYDRHINSPADLQRTLAGYFGLVSFLDEQIGKILTVLSETGLADTTRMIYTSDHGDNLGSRGLWGKATMYEESAGIPMLLAGEGVPAGAVCTTPVTLCDVSATILDAVGASDAIAELELPGVSLLDLAVASPKDRTVVSEFHTYGPNAFYMLRDQRHKYVYYVGAPPQLFDLEADPEELNDLGLDLAHAPQRREFEAHLRALLDPEWVDREAKADQARTADRYGGFEMLRRREKMSFTPPPTADTH
jgi:choline-sulfatase